MNTIRHLGAPSQDSVPMRPCLFLMVILIIPTLLVILSFYKIGTGQDQYWEVQIDSFVFLNTFFSAQSAFWFNLTQLGDAYLLLPLMSFFILTKPQIWAAFFGAIPFATLLTHGGKSIASIPRPAAVLEPGQVNIIGDTLTGYNSLPSGQTATVFVVGTIIMLVLFFSHNCKWRWWMLPMVLTASTLLALSRVAVGAHWPLDVLFGAVCGFLGGVSGIYLVQRYAGWWSWIKQPRYWLILGVVMFLWSLSLLPVLYSDSFPSSLAQWAASVVGMVCAGQLIYRYYFFKSRYEQKLDYWQSCAKF